MINSTILVIDNEPSICDIFSHFLAENGFNIQSAVSFDSAFTYLEKNTYDLVLADVHMHGMAFTDALDRLQWMHPTLPIMAVTGIPHAISSNDRLKLFGVIEKPFAPHILLQHVRSALSMHTQVTA